MEDLNSNSFCFGTLYGFIAAGGIGMILSQMRAARGRIASKDRTLNNFPASAQQNLTASKVVQSSRQATWTYAALVVVQAFFIGLLLIGIYFILL